jgi:hypothetical protein
VVIIALFLHAKTGTTEFTDHPEKGGRRENKPQRHRDHKGGKTRNVSRGGAETRRREKGIVPVTFSKSIPNGFDFSALSGTPRE